MHLHIDRGDIRCIHFVLEANEYHFYNECNQIHNLVVALNQIPLFVNNLLGS